QGTSKIAKKRSVSGDPKSAFSRWKLSSANAWTDFRDPKCIPEGGPCFAVEVGRSRHRVGEPFYPLGDFESLETERALAVQLRCRERAKFCCVRSEWGRSKNFCGARVAGRFGLALRARLCL